MIEKEKEEQQETYSLSMNNLEKKIPKNYDSLVIPKIEAALKNVKGDAIRNKVYNYIIYYYNKGQSEGILESIYIRRPDGETGKVYYKIGDGKIDVRLIKEEDIHSKSSDVVVSSDREHHSSTTKKHKTRKPSNTSHKLTRG